MSKQKQQVELKESEQQEDISKIKDPKKLKAALKAKSENNDNIDHKSQEDQLKDTTGSEDEAIKGSGKGEETLSKEDEKAIGPDMASQLKEDSDDLKFFNALRKAKETSDAEMQKLMTEYINEDEYTFQVVYKVQKGGPNGGFESKIQNVKLKYNSLSFEADERLREIREKKQEIMNIGSVYDKVAGDYREQLKAQEATPEELREEIQFPYQKFEKYADKLNIEVNEDLTMVQVFNALNKINREMNNEITKFSLREFFGMDDAMIKQCVIPIARALGAAALSRYDTLFY